MTNPVDAPDPDAPDPDAPDPDSSPHDDPTEDVGTTEPVPVLVLNGPNLARLGAREPEAYGSATYADLEALCREGGEHLGLAVELRQSDHEGELLGWLHEAAETGTPVVLNAGGLTHTSVVLGDACAMLQAPLVEVHISNVFAREQFRHHSFVSPHATGVIAGLGLEGYVLALSWLASQLT